MRTIAGVSVVLVGALMGGCPDFSALLNPQFQYDVGASKPVANLPGEAPALLVAVENRTNRTVEMVVSYRDIDQAVHSFTEVLDPGQKSAQALACPVPEITLGDVANLDQVGARVRLGTGLPTDPFIEVEPFGVLLVNEANYNCGDEVRFVVQASGATSSGYQTIAYIQRAE
jgi:hypothetical protein